MGDRGGILISIEDYFLLLETVDTSSIISDVQKGLIAFYRATPNYLHKDRERMVVFIFAEIIRDVNHKSLWLYGIRSISYNDLNSSGLNEDTVSALDFDKRILILIQSEKIVIKSSSGDVLVNTNLKDFILNDYDGEFEDYYISKRH